MRFDRIIHRVASVYRRSGGKHLSAQMRAIKDGRLIDMQVPPFQQFNQIMQNDCRIVMTMAAYRTCIELPGKTRGKDKVPANGRWGIVYLSFMQEFQHRADDPQEGTFDVSVLMPDGFNVPKTLKVVLDHDFDGEDAFVFMLPDEPWPLRILPE